MIFENLTCLQSTSNKQKNGGCREPISYDKSTAVLKNNSKSIFNFINFQKEKKNESEKLSL